MYTQEQNDNTALIVCAKKGSDRCMEYLLEHNADPDKTNRFGLTPMAFSLRGGHIKCVRLLLLAGGIYNSPALIWEAQHATKPFMWLDFNDQLLQLLLMATPNICRVSEAAEKALYEHLTKENNLKADLLKLLVLCGKKRSSEEIDAIGGDEELKEFLHFYSSNVPKLQHLARVEVRSQMQYNVMHAYQRLELPITLQDYLVYKMEVKHCKELAEGDFKTLKQH